MPLTTWITNADLTETVANAIGQISADFDSKWTALISKANTDAYYFTLRKLFERGYSKANIDAWPENATFNRDIGLLFALQRGGVLSTFSDTFIRSIDRRKELDEALLFDSEGTPIFPDASGFECSAGATDWSGGIDYEFSPDMDFTFSPSMRNQPRQGPVRDAF